MLAKLIHVFGRRGVVIVALSLVVAAIQSVAELGLALFLQVFLVAVGVADASMLPGYLDWGRALPPAHAAGIVILIGLLRSIGVFLGTQIATLGGETVVGRLRSLAVHDLLFPSAKSFSPNSDFQYRFGELSSRTYQWLWSLVGALVSIGQATVLLSIMLVTSWQESLVSLGGLAIAAGAFWWLQRVVRTVTARLPAKQLALSASLERIVRNRIYISLMRMEESEEGGVLADLAALQRLNLRNGAATNLIQAIGPVLGVMVVALVVFLGLNVLGTSGLHLLSLLYLLLRFVQSAQAALGAVLQAQANAPFMLQVMDLAARFSHSALEHANRLNRVLPLLGSLEDVQSLSSGSLQQRQGPAMPPSVELRGVSFAYQISSPVLVNFDLTVDPGEQLAIVGPSGVGKSTLLLLLLGALTPDKGVVLINGVPPVQWRKDARPRVGYVGPDPFLILGNLADNLCYGLDRQTSEQELIDALLFAKLDDFATPEKLKRMVGEDLQGLSAGQKQRLCLARAFLCHPDLLILDEATANVDEATEADIADAVMSLKGSCTTVLVTHRRGLMVHADKVLDMASVQDGLKPRGESRSIEKGIAG